MTHDHKPLTEHAHPGEGCNFHAPQGKSAERLRLGWVIVLTGVTMVVEAVFGWLSGSLALLSDAGHMLTHFGALLISLIAIVIARKPSPPSRSYGMYRIEILAALLNSVALLAITLLILVEAVDRIFNPRPIQTLEMLIVALLGLAVNVISAAILWKVGHGEDLNVRAAFLHMLGDTASSIGVVAGAIIIRFTGALWIDPVLSVLICVVILVWAYNLTRQAVSVLLEATPKGISLRSVEETLESDAEVRAVHDLHIWSITSGMHALTAHVEVPDQPLSSLQQIRYRLETLMSEKFGICHTNFQFEVPKKDRQPISP